MRLDRKRESARAAFSARRPAIIDVQVPNGERCHRRTPPRLRFGRPSLSSTPIKKSRYSLDLVVFEPALSFRPRRICSCVNLPPFC